MTQRISALLLVAFLAVLGVAKAEVEAPFKAARATYHLAGGETLTRVLGGSCEVGRAG